MKLFDKHDLEALGLGDIEAGDAREVFPDIAEVTKGDTKQDLRPLERWLSDVPPGTFADQPGSGLSEVGVQLQIHRTQTSIWRLNLGLSGRTYPPEAQGITRTAAQGFVVLDTRVIPERVALLRLDNQGVGLRREGESLLVGPLRPASQGAMFQDGAGLSIPAIHSGLAGWASRWEDDWLREEVETLLELGDSWLHVVALGMSARLVTSRANARDRLRQLLAGELDPAPPPALGWARRQAPEVLDFIEARARTAALELERDLVELLARTAPEDGAWQRDVLAAMRERDLIEGVLLLLDEASGGESTDLRDLLAEIDAAGRDFVAAVPRFSVVPEDAHLQRALQADPASWWVEPMVW